MAIIMPFMGIRANPSYAAQVAAPPYDTLSTSEARAMAAGNKKSFLWIDKPEIAFPDSHDPYASDVYLRGKTELERFLAEKILIQDHTPCLYLYRLTMQDRTQTGLMTLTSVEEYLTGKIKKHEHTRPEKVNDRATHIEVTMSQASPVFSTFKQNQEIRECFGSALAEPPVVDCTSDDGVRHQFWVIQDSDLITRFVAAFSKLDALYIADGHHRSEAAAECYRRLKQKNAKHTGKESHCFFLNGLFPSDELYIMPYNRVVKDLNGLSEADFLERVSQNFSVSESPKEVEPKYLHTFGMYLNSNWYSLIAKPGSFDESHPTESIDAAILGSNLIAPILGIENPRTDKRIDFVGGIRGTAELARLVDSKKFAVAFSLCATTIEQLLTVADAGQVMPPKSTWFEPKLRSGLLVHRLTE